MTPQSRQIEDPRKELFVEIVNSENIVYSGKVKSVTSFNEKGRFDVIPMHTNFISIIHKKVALHELSGSRQEFQIESGIMKVKGNIIQIFLGVEALDTGIIASNTTPPK